MLLAGCRLQPVGPVGDGIAIPQQPLHPRLGPVGAEEIGGKGPSHSFLQQWPAEVEISQKGSMRPPGPVGRWLPLPVRACAEARLAALTAKVRIAPVLILQRLIFMVWLFLCWVKYGLDDEALN